MGKKMWHNSPGVKEEGVLPCAEIFSREEEDLVTLQNHRLLLKVSVTASKDAIAHPGGVT